MRLAKYLVSAAAAFALVPALGASPAGAADGKALFQEKKCNTCHSIKAAGIEKTKKKKAPDLSGVGKELNADQIAKFVKKESEHKSVYSDKVVKHKKKWKGSDEDLKTIAAFLASQKSDMKVADEGGEDEGGDDEKE